MTRKKKVIKNLLSEILPQLLIMVLGLLRSKYYLDYLGGDTVGLVNLFNQIVGYLSLVEGGIGQAVIYKLYKPTKSNNYSKIAEIRNGVRSIFGKIIMITIFLAIICGFIIPFLIKDNQYSLIYILTNFILYVISEIILYMTIFERSIYVATEKGYKVNYAIKISLIVKYISQILLAILVKNITIIFIVLIVIGVIENTIIKYMAKKDYKNLPITKKQDKSVLSDVKNLLVHKVAGLVATNIDIILISKFIGLGKVLIYSTYLMYLNAIVSLTNKISRAMVGTIGNILIEDRKKAHKLFVEFNGITFLTAMIVGSSFNLFINFFIQIFYSGKVETSMIVSTLFTIILVYSIIRIPLITYSEGAGMFKETKICPIIESVINLFLSIILVNYIGIIGCLIGTIFSLVISEYFIKPNIIYKKLFEKNVREYYFMNIKFLLLLFINILISCLISKWITINNLGILFIYGATYFTINVIVNLILYKIMRQDYVFEIMKKIK